MDFKNPIQTFDGQIRHSLFNSPVLHPRQSVLDSKRLITLESTFLSQLSEFNSNPQQYLLMLFHNSMFKNNPHLCYHIYGYIIVVVFSYIQKNAIVGQKHQRNKNVLIFF